MEQGLSRDPFCHLARHFGIFGNASAGQMAKLERDADENAVVPFRPLHLPGSGKRAFRDYSADGFRGNRQMSVEFGEGVGE